MKTKASRNDEIYLNALPLIKELYAQGMGFNKIAAKAARGLNKTNLRRRLIADGIHVVREGASGADELRDAEFEPLMLGALPTQAKGKHVELLLDNGNRVTRTKWAVHPEDCVGVIGWRYVEPVTA